LNRFLGIAHLLEVRHHLGREHLHEFNAHALVSTYGPSPVIVVNGSIRNRIGMNMGINVLGHGNRPNATIGRAIKLILRNLGGLRPGEIERAVLGSPAKYGACYPEFEERSPWEPILRMTCWKSSLTEL
jgi:hypothetical protein